VLDGGRKNFQGALQHSKINKVEGTADVVEAILRAHRSRVLRQKEVTRSYYSQECLARALITPAELRPWSMVQRGLPELLASGMSSMTLP